jgi:hypothetical protein
MLAALLAEFEPELIRERTGEGARARDGARREVRSPRKLTPHQRRDALERLQARETQADVARTYKWTPRQ